MIPIHSHPQVQKFLQAVCQEVKAVELHGEIREELTVHITDRVEELLRRGEDEAHAIDLAVEAMGSAKSIGRDMHRIHRPSMDWSLISLLALIVGIGLFAIYAVQAADLSYTREGFFFEKKLICTGLGCMGLIGLWFFDYRRLMRYSNSLFLVALLLMIICIFKSSTINGSVYFVIGRPIDVMTICTFLLVVALPGMKLPKYWTVPETILRSVYVLGIPLAMYSAGNSLSGGFLYLCAAIGYFWMYRRSVYQFIAVMGVLASAAVSFVISLQTQGHYLMARLTSFLTGDKEEAGYLTYQSVKAIHTAGWWGHGFAASNHYLPYPYSDTLFTYLIYAFGWAGGLVIAAIAVLFISRIAALARSVREDYGRRLIVLLLIVMGVQFVFPVLMALGLAPFAGMALPFLSYGNTLLLLHFGAIGLILTVYKRKNMIRTLQTGVR